MVFRQSVRINYRALGAFTSSWSNVYDDPTLPHGGHEDGGWERFRPFWGIEELSTPDIVMLRA